MNTTTTEIRSSARTRSRRRLAATAAIVAATAGLAIGASTAMADIETVTMVCEHVQRISPAPEGDQELDNLKIQVGTPTAASASDDGAVGTGAWTKIDGLEVTLDRAGVKATRPPTVTRKRGRSAAAIWPGNTKYSNVKFGRGA